MIEQTSDRFIEMIEHFAKLAQEYEEKEQSNDRTDIPIITTHVDRLASTIPHQVHISYVPEANNIVIDTSFRDERVRRYLEELGEKRIARKIKEIYPGLFAVCLSIFVKGRYLEVIETISLDLKEMGIDVSVKDVSDLFEGSN